MEVSEDVQRELVYGLNALLLASHPDVPDGDVAAARLLAVLRDEGPRFHEPELVAAWQDESGCGEELEDALAEAFDLVLEELTDAEEAFSAHQVLGLLAEEPFWTLTWGGSGGQSYVPMRPPDAPSVPLPLSLRHDLVGTIDQLEAALFDLHTDQRSVHDQLDEGLVGGLVAATVRNIRDLAAVRKIPDLPTWLEVSAGIRPGFADVLAEVQRWKLSVEWDPTPDAGDAEWTMRVLERLYRIDWFLDPDPAP